MKKSQINAANETIKSAKKAIRKADKQFASISRVIREMKLDNEMNAILAPAWKENLTPFLGIELNQLTVSLFFELLQSEQFVEDKKGNKCAAVFAERKVYEEKTAIIDGQEQTIKVPAKNIDGTYRTEVYQKPIREGRWTVDAVFTLLSQAIELQQSK